jgi:hypothetical protein
LGEESALKFAAHAATYAARRADACSTVVSQNVQAAPDFVGDV